jgi:putative selenate reductase molybdopterin-binding subunit
VTTVESLDVAAGELHPIQRAFVETGALQSGYSAGAMVLATKALLERCLDPSEAEIRDALSGILDRETGYVKVVEAVRRAAALLRGEELSPFQPVLVERLAGRELAVSSDRSPWAVSPAVPRVVPSADVPATTTVGKAEGKVDAVRLVKGKPAFAADVEPRGLLHARILRSPHAHARIVAIDDAAARALPGVHAVLHCLNTPRVKYASGGQSWPNPYPWDQVSFDDKVRHVGDRVAAVAAETAELAEEACRRIEVTYELLPAVFDPAAATAEGAPVIHDEHDSIGIHDASRNVAAHVEGHTVHDIETAFARADRVFEQTFNVQRVQPSSTARSSRISPSAGSTRTSASCSGARRRCRSTSGAWSLRFSACR